MDSFAPACLNSVSQSRPGALLPGSALDCFYQIGDGRWSERSAFGLRSEWGVCVMKVVCVTQKPEQNRAGEALRRTCSTCSITSFVVEQLCPDGI